MPTEAEIDQAIDAPPFVPSARQRAILDYIAAYVGEKGYQPTIRAMADALGISSTSVVAYHLQKLEDGGLITREAYVSRGLAIVDDGTSPVPVTPGANVVVVIDGREVVAPFARLAA